MGAVRATVFAHGRLALLLVAFALALRAIIPAGYMLAPSDAMILNVTLCNDGARHETVSIAIPMDHDRHDRSGMDVAKDHCAFSSLSMASLAGADPALLIAALAFIIAIVVHCPSPVRRRQLAFLRPHLRGPPARN